MKRKDGGKRGELRKKSTRKEKGQEMAETASEVGGFARCGLAPQRVLDFWYLQQHWRLETGTGTGTGTAAMEPWGQSPANVAVPIDVC